MPVLTIDEAAALPASGGVLLDARAGERYRGEVEPIDPRAGHVPGAVSAPTTENLADGRHLPVGRRAAPTGSPTLGRAAGDAGRRLLRLRRDGAHEVAALAVAGIDAALWPGSWSQWSTDPDRPERTGT